VLTASKNEPQISTCVILAIILAAEQVPKEQAECLSRPANGSGFTACATA
jgi:hypothetical protein